MILVLSPAKSLDFDTPPTLATHTLPRCLEQSDVLIERLRQLSPAQIASLMGISDKLAALNFARYADWAQPFTPANAKQAVLAFNGDVYDGLAAPQLPAADLAFAQTHLRILSGLYGLLRPLDLIQPYRLEMGTRLANVHGKDLYAFWGDTITTLLADDLAACGADALVNLASEEYFKAVRSALLPVRVIQPVFEDEKAGRFRVVSFHAKRARGAMARYALTRRLTDAAALKDFAEDGYAYCEEVSDAQRWIFRRRAA